MFRQIDSGLLSAKNPANSAPYRIGSLSIMESREARLSTVWAHRAATLSRLGRPATARKHARQRRLRKLTGRAVDEEKTGRNPVRSFGRNKVLRWPNGMLKRPEPYRRHTAGKRWAFAMHPPVVVGGDRDAQAGRLGNAHQGLEAPFVGGRRGWVVVVAAHEF